MSITNRVAALERAPKPKALETMPLGEFLCEVARAIEADHPATARLLRESTDLSALDAGRAALEAVIEKERRKA